ncbi:hypothetical protein [Sporomusa acidovorans]|uniref:hypothetical protein n=1 Tax=Sporomusa acidovorans TaxID=112900 RepID=UPI00088E050F|nr:hypothetical protein [Sporomusa acidovorans]OZC19073.1 hypothetical protein SPACI_31590 [Sporomusa acidovorans DSM 3132]SDD66374.1 hypothetical protein SAMN04488499_100319 [Sporomusa acidovorans]
MRFFKVVLSGILVLAMAGGGVYWAQMNGWNVFDLPMLTGGHSQHQASAPQGHSGHGGGSTQPPLSPFNNLASQNKDKLVQASVVLNQVMEQITNDPYSQITVGRRTDSGEGSGNISITPREGVTINIAGEKEKGHELPPGTTAVYDQAKLEQLHYGIFKFSQAIALINDLNNDLTDQSVLVEANPPDLQTYVMRYNLLLQNRTKLNQATRLLGESMTLVNINPYAPASGYVYNSQRMKELHQGIAELARISLQLNRLNEDMNQQLMQAAYDAKLARVQAMNPMQAAGMNQAQNHSAHNAQSGTDFFSNSSGVFSLGLIVIIFGLVLGVLVLIKKLIRELIAPQE